jgi:hypothetical protein
VARGPPSYVAKGEFVNTSLSAARADQTRLATGGKYGTENGSGQESGEGPILRGFPEHDEISFGDCHALSLEEQVA